MIDIAEQNRRTIARQSADLNLYAAQVAALRAAFHAAISSPKGVVPAGTEHLYDQNHPALNRD